MAEDPLGDRLRATFAAEQDDIQRRHQSAGSTPARSRSFKWIPFAVAAALVAIAGLAFISNRSNDQAVELDIAAQPTESPLPPAPLGTPAPGDAEGNPVPTSALPSPLDSTLPIPYVTGENMCGSIYNPARTMVIGSHGQPAPIFAEPILGSGMSSNPTRSLPIISEVDLAGGCTAANNDGRRVEFYEVVGTQPGETEWIRSDYLVDTGAAGRDVFDASPNACGTPVPLRPHFVWGIGPDDPDGGLVAHTVAGANTPVTHILRPNALVSPTAGCRLTDDGATWYELAGGGFGWANARYVAPTQLACLVGEQSGTLTRDGTDSTREPFFYTVAEGDLLTSIATGFDVTVDAIVRANPDKNPDLIILGELWRIPGSVNPPELMTGPVDGLAIVDGERTAFARADEGTYRWYPSGGVTVGAECFATVQARRPICISGTIELLDEQSFAPIWSGTVSTTAWTSGRTTDAAQGSGAAELLEVNVMTSDAGSLFGFFDPAQTNFAEGHCVREGASGSCTRVAGASRTAGIGTDEASRVWSAGSADSAADHVHDIRTESSDECTRIVIEFGSGASTDAHDTTATLPPVIVDQQLDDVQISADGWQWQSSFDDPTRIDYDNGIGLFTLSLNYEFAVELLHQPAEPHVRFLNNPARVVIDLFPIDSATSSNRAYGERFVLRRPIQLDPTGQGIPVDNNIIVEGFGRPFEAAGLYRIWSVPDDVDANTFLTDPPPPLIENFFPTSGWAEGWGTFSIDLPDLDVGTYIAVFGELPPTDEIGFYGTGQLFRVADSPTEEPGNWPEAVLLPNVQLPPE